MASAIPGPPSLPSGTRPVGREVVLDVAGRGAVADDEPVPEDRRLWPTSGASPPSSRSRARRASGRSRRPPSGRAPAAPRTQSQTRTVASDRSPAAARRRSVTSVPAGTAPYGIAIQVVAAVVGEVVVADRRRRPRAVAGPSDATGGGEPLGSGAGAGWVAPSTRRPATQRRRREPVSAVHDASGRRPSRAGARGRPGAAHLVSRRSAAPDRREPGSVSRRRPSIADGHRARPAAIGGRARHGSATRRRPARSGSRGPASEAASPALTATTMVAASSSRRQAHHGPSAPPVRTIRGAASGLAWRTAIAPSRRVQQLAVPRRLVPAHRRPAERVHLAGHADLVAVVDRRRAGQRHLDERRERHGCRVPADHRSARAACRGCRAGSAGRP